MTVSNRKTTPGIKLITSNRMGRTCLLILLALSVSSGWSHVHHDHYGNSSETVDWDETDSATAIEQFLRDPFVDGLKLDGEMQIRLKLLHSDQTNWRNMNRVGWLLVNRARSDQDESFYSLAERLAEINLRLNGRRPETMALWIHTLLQEHRFVEAKSAAEELVEMRGEPLDYALRGDAALEQGDLAEAKADYLEFLKRSPSLPSYARWGHLNWLLGNDDVAISAWKEAIDRGRGASEESVAWCKAKLAEVYLYSGDLAIAAELADESLLWQSNYGIGRFVSGRISWFLGDKDSAIESLEIAVGVDPLPEWLWWLEDVYRSVGRIRMADDVRERILEYGSSIDRRATALYLSIRGIGKNAALEMAKAELENRADAATFDALGFCWLRNGQLGHSKSALANASAKGRVPGRGPLHQGMLAWETGDAEAALKFWNRAYDARFAMTPSEIEVLKENLAKANTAILEKEKLFAQGRLENE